MVKSGREMSEGVFVPAYVLGHSHVAE
jgi:hypothetical protein